MKRPDAYEAVRRVMRRRRSMKVQELVAEVQKRCPHLAVADIDTAWWQMCAGKRPELILKGDVVRLPRKKRR